MKITIEVPRGVGMLIEHMREMKNIPFDVEELFSVIFSEELKRYIKNLCEEKRLLGEISNE